MELRRPRLADKKAVIDMMEEFEKYQSPHDGGFWDTETCLKIVFLLFNLYHLMM